MTKKLTLTFTLVFVFFLSNFTFAQQETIVSGLVKDAITGETIIGATIIVKGRVVGSSTDLEGNFNFGINLPPPFTLIFSAVGYELREVDITEDYQELTVNLRTKREFSTPYIKWATRKEGNLLQSPVAVQKQDLLTINQLPTSDFYEGLGHLRDMQMTTTSLGFQSLNARGFASIANTRMLQIIDGVDNAPPGLNFAIGNLVGVSPLDIAEIEVVSGSSSALYGPSAFNGAIFMNSKDPFSYTGLSGMLKNGVTNTTNAGRNPFIEMALRYAEAPTDNFAYKMNFSYMRGTDWHATDYTDEDNEMLINPEKGRGVNPAYDGVNVYGDEIVSSFFLPNLEGGLDTLRIARTGYNETDLIDYLSESAKFDASFNYKLTDDFEIIGSYRFGYGNSQFQGANRYALRDLTMHQFKLEAKSDNFMLRGYTSSENAGNSYDMRFLGWNLNRAWKSDEAWFTEYLGAFSGQVPNIAAKDHEAARAFADRDRLIPGSEEFMIMFDSLSTLADFQRGAKLSDNSKLQHIEGLYDFSDAFNDKLEVVVGGNWRRYKLDSEGNLFNDIDAPITFSEFGSYAQVAKGFMKKERLRILASARYDKNNNFDGQFTPRASIVYSHGRRKEHNFRVSFQTGFRNPDNQSQYIALHAGVVNLLGGVSDNVLNYSNDFTYNDTDTTTTTITVTGDNVYNNSYTSASVQRFSLTQDPADLVQASVDYINPEQVTTYEAGYRGVFNKRLFLDLGYYRSTYTNMIGNTTVLNPFYGDTDGSGSGIPAIVNGDYAAYQLYTNADGEATVQGVTVAFDLLLDLDFRLAGNYNYTSFAYTGTDAIVLPGFNTPGNRFSVSFGNPNVYKGFGFSVSHRWSEGYKWKSTFGEGDISAINVTSAQVSYTVPESSVRIKLGGSNMFGNEYQTAYGLPTVGAQYFIKMTFNEF